LHDWRLAVRLRHRAFAAALLLALTAVAAGASRTAPLTERDQAKGVAGAPPASEVPVHAYTITKTLAGATTPVDLTFVLTRDEIYVPIAVRRPEGTGPFPAILMGSGNGAGAMPEVERQAARLGPMMDRMLARGYVVAYAEYRNEIPYLYEQIDRSENLSDNISGGQRTLKSNPTLDSDDFIAIIQYLQSLPYVDKDAVGTYGVSHSGELMLKAASQITFGAAVPNEGAAHEFLSVDTGPAAPRKGTEIQFQDIEVVKRHADKAKAMARIRRINTPFLHLGRDTDHLQGIFRLSHEWMKEAGKDSTWVSFDHPEHGYGFLYADKNGAYKPDPIQQKAFEVVMAFFDEHLKHSHGTTNSSR
jgi:dienelactone hydrolase